MKKFNEKVRQAVCFTEKKLGERSRMWSEASNTEKIAFAIIMVLAGVAMAIMLSRSLKAMVYVSTSLWGNEAMTRSVVIAVIAVMLLDEINKRGILTSILKILCIIIIVKVIGEMSGADTKAIDDVLAWIVDVPNLISKELPWLKFW